jgi:hypothetical protein
MSGIEVLSGPERRRAVERGAEALDRRGGFCIAAFNARSLSALAVILCIIHGSLR